MKKTRWYIILITAIAWVPLACQNEISGNAEMVRLLATSAENAYSAINPFCDKARLRYYDSAFHAATTHLDSINSRYLMAVTLLEAGNEPESLRIFEELLARAPNVKSRLIVMRQCAIVHMRMGERANCQNNHTGESCIFPIAGGGVHRDKMASQKAISLFEQILQLDPHDVESRWLLNIAYMTTGEYPHNVPAAYLIKGLDTDSSSSGVRPFIDVAIGMGLNTNNLAGGSIVDDFTGDGYFDIVTSAWGLDEGMRFCRYNGDGTFSDISRRSGLKQLTGGLNMMQTDYNNDGLKDIFVVRGAWKRFFGKEPNSLLRNNGDGTFTDVTAQSGLLSFHPTQTATWNDFNNDGWLDVFIGNEATPDDPHTCELYINNGDGTFKEVAKLAGCDVTAFVKGVTSGDYDNDGRPDLFISTLNGIKILFKNETEPGKDVRFTDMTVQGGLHRNTTRTFPTWFWDYDNDGWLDILVSGYEFEKSLGWYAGAEAMGLPVGNSGKLFLYRNNHDGTFEDVSQKVGLDKIVFAMGCNFGDIDNDGYPDIYLGTGNPVYQSLVPNKMFKNINGARFIDVTSAARVGNLQKGHGVSFADLDYDGDQDIYIEMGGAYTGDAYQNSLYINPGQPDNRWISISLEGKTCNRAAIGARIKVTFIENGVRRSVYRDVSSGGSFGANPLAQHIGIGQAPMIESIEIKWPVSNKTQTFSQVKPGQYLRLKEGDPAFTTIKLEKTDFVNRKEGVIGCKPE